MAEMYHLYRGPEGMKRGAKPKFLSLKVKSTKSPLPPEGVLTSSTKERYDGRPVGAYQ